jgi:hypothetical protein
VATPPRSLLESATARGRVIRQGDIVCIIMDGGGAMVVPSQEYLQASKWAQSKPPSGNLLTDRARFLDKITSLVSRPGSLQATRGNDKALEKLARAMQHSGYDLSEWTLPPELKNPPPLGAPTEPARKRSAEASAEDPAAPADSATEPEPPA